MGMRKEVPAGDDLANFHSSTASLLIYSGLAIAIAWVLGMAVGCGSGGGNSVGKTPPGNTMVTLLATSTANDQLISFGVRLESLTLTSRSGNTTTLFTTPVGAEFIHLNGRAEPLVAGSVPDGVYTSATAVVKSAGFECVTFNSSGGLVTGSFNYQNTPVSVTVSIPMPITITGPAMGLSLDLLVSKSATWTTCDPAGPNDPNPYSITPTFSLTPVVFSSGNVALPGLEGLVSSVNASGNSFTVAAADGLTWSVASNRSTAFHGVTNLSSLRAGMPVDMDVSIQQNGSLLATRVAVADKDTADLSIFSGPTESVAAAWPALFASEVEAQGYLAPVFNAAPFSFGSAIFQTSGQFTNLDALPFAASFSAVNIVAGQIVSITTHATKVLAAPTYVPATVITLQPQTIDGTVSAVSSDSGFDMYTVTLAPYDLFPQLAVQGGQTTLLQNPNTVVVYVGNDTQMLNTTSLTVGNVLRFNGLVFNDHGTLRMDCA